MPRPAGARGAHFGGPVLQSAHGHAAPEGEAGGAAGEGLLAAAAAAGRREPAPAPSGFSDLTPTRPCTTAAPASALARTVWRSGSPRRALRSTQAGASPTSRLGDRWDADGVPASSGNAGWSARPPGLAMSRTPNALARCSRVHIALPINIQTCHCLPATLGGRPAPQRRQRAPARPADFVTTLEPPADPLTGSSRAAGSPSEPRRLRAACKRPRRASPGPHDSCQGAPSSGSHGAGRGRPAAAGGGGNAAATAARPQAQGALAVSRCCTACRQHALEPSQPTRVFIPAGGGAGGG